MSQNLLPVVILAGGYGTRLGALTASTPKALLEINGEPFIAHQLRLLRSVGVEDVIVCASHLGRLIQDFVSDGRQFGVHVRFVFDGPQLLGTAGALVGALPYVEQALFVLYGDSYLACDFSRVQSAFERQGKLGLMTVYRNEGRWDRSNVEFEGDRIVIYDKVATNERMQHIDYGLGVLRREAIELVPSGRPYDLAALYRDLLARDELGAFEVHERFYEVGSVAGLRETHEYLSRSAPGVA